MCIHKISKLCPEYSWMIILWPNGFLSQPGDLLGSTVFQNCICFREIWGNAGQAPALLPVLWEPNFAAAWAVDQPGLCQVLRGSRMARTEPKLELRARQPSGVWWPEGNEKGGKDPAVLINHRMTPEHQLLLGRADLILGKGAEQTWGSREASARGIDRSPALLGNFQQREIPARKSAGKGQPETPGNMWPSYKMKLKTCATSSLLNDL